MAAPILIVYLICVYVSVRYGHLFHRNKTYWWNQNHYLEVLYRFFTFWTSCIADHIKSMSVLTPLLSSQCQSDDDQLDPYSMVSGTSKQKQVSESKKDKVNEKGFSSWFLQLDVCSLWCRRVYVRSSHPVLISFEPQFHFLSISSTFHLLHI